MFSFRRLWAVTKKEYLELIRNWISLLLNVASPLLLFFLFAYGMQLDVKNIPLAILDEDKSSYSRKLIDTFSSSSTFDIKYMAKNLNELDKLLKINLIRAYVVIPHDFSEKIQKGRPQNILAVIDATYPNRAAIMGGYIESTLASFNDLILERFFDKKFGRSAESSLPVNVFVSSWFNPTLRSDFFIVPGVIAIMLIFLPPIVTAISLSKEKELGSILNMYCSPVKKAEYLIGKTIPYICIAYFNFLLFLIFTLTIFQVPLRGNLFLLLFASAAYVIAIAGIGLFVAVLVNTQISAIIIVSICTITPSFMNSGFMFPVICMGPDAQATAYLLLPTYYIDFIRKIMIKGVGLNYLFTDILGMCVIGFVLYGLSILLFKKKLG